MALSVQVVGVGPTRAGAVDAGPADRSHLRGGRSTPHEMAAGVEVTMPCAGGEVTVSLRVACCVESTGSQPAVAVGRRSVGRAAAGRGGDREGAEDCGERGAERGVVTAGCGATVG